MQKEAIYDQMTRSKNIKISCGTSKGVNKLIDQLLIFYKPKKMKKRSNVILHLHNVKIKII